MNNSEENLKVIAPYWTKFIVLHKTTASYILIGIASECTRIIAGDEGQVRH